MTVLGWVKFSVDPWNVFDVVVTLLVTLQMSATYSAFGADVYSRVSQVIAADFVQILRLCRLFRLARFVRELGMLIQSFLMSIRALSWIVTLLLLWFYLSA